MQEPGFRQELRENIWKKIFKCLKSKCFIIGGSGVAIIATVLTYVISKDSGDKKRNRLPDPPKFPQSENFN